MLLSYLFHGWCYFKAGRGKITLRIEKEMKEWERERRAGRKEKEKEKALQCDLISCLRQMTLYSDMFPVTASINWLEQSLPQLQLLHHTDTHTHTHTHIHKAWDTSLTALSIWQHYMPQYWWWFTYSHPLTFWSNEGEMATRSGSAVGEKVEI